MHTILFRTNEHTMDNPMAARLLTEALRLARQERTCVARGLVRLALKIESGTLSVREAVALETPIKQAA